MNAPELNARQRTYLLAALEVDQRQETRHKRAFQSGEWAESRRPSSDWRGMPFGRWTDILGQPPTALREACGGADEGSGSTWASLARRGLVRLQDRQAWGHPVELPHVTLTPKGRKLARELTGTVVERRAPGVLARSTWKALAAAWNAGEAGLRDPGGSWYGGVHWNTWLLLLNRRSGPLVESRSQEERHPTLGAYRQVYFLRLNEAGCTYYRERWAANSAAYPDVEAPNPITVLLSSSTAV